MPRKGGYNVEEFAFEIEKPLHQVFAPVEGAPAAIFHQLSVIGNSMSLPSFIKISQDRAHDTPIYTDVNDLCKIFWKEIGNFSPIYGADILHSLFDSDLEYWNLNNLNSILRDTLRSDIEGINCSFLYCGAWKTSFSWHVEDMYLHSISYLHYGADKIWDVIPPFQGFKFEKFLQEIMPKSAKACKNFAKHKNLKIKKEVLVNNNITCNTFIQKEGQFLITFPFSYHSGINAGFNIAEAVNFATESWIELGKLSIRNRDKCYHCPKLNLDMNMFVKKYQESSYGGWKLYREPYECFPIKYLSKSYRSQNPDINFMHISKNFSYSDELKNLVDLAFPIDMKTCIYVDKMIKNNITKFKEGIKKFIDVSSFDGELHVYYENYKYYYRCPFCAFSSGRKKNFSLKLSFQNKIQSPLVGIVKQHFSICHEEFLICR